MGQKSSKQPRVDSRYLAPQKPSCFNEVDLRKLRRLIKDRKLAPCYPGLDSESRELEECPICFLKYPSLNRAVCCHKPICTECFLQVNSLKPGHSPACPYCKADFSIYFQGPASTEQRLKTEAEDKEQAYALERSRQGEQEESSRPQEQQLPAVPYSPAPQSAPASLAKLPSQASSAEMHLWDYLPHELLMAEAVHFEVDLDEAMLMQGISASLEQQASQPPASSSTSRIHGPLDECHPPCTPPQLEADANAAQQACRAALGPNLASAESKQPKLSTGPVIANSSRSQEPTPETASSLKGAGRGLQVDSGPAAAAAATLHSSAGSNEFLLPPSGSQSDGIVHLSVTSYSQQPASEHSTANYVLTSTPQLGPPSRPVAAVSSPDTPPQSLCFPSDSQNSSSSSQGRAVDSLPQSQCAPSGLQRTSSAREGSRVQTAGTGDTLAGFLQQQAKAPHVGTEASLPQPASGAHELRVGMVVTDFTIVPSAGQHYTNSSCPTGTQYGVRQSVNKRPDCPVSDGASASVQCSVEVSRQGSVMVVSKQERGDAESVPHSMQPGSYEIGCEMQQGLGDLTNGAVMLQNPDGSVQYVVLTSDEQRAVQLSMQAKRNKNAETAEGFAHQVEGSPEDQAVQAAIAEGDAILQRLYQVPQAAQEHPSEVCCAGSDALENTARGNSTPHADPMLRRIEEADARLRLLYSSS